MLVPALPLAEWENFYVIIGSSAAALRAFATPTVVQFCAVLLLAAFLTTPRHTITSLRACLLACGAGGLGYVSWVTVQARQQRSYVPALSECWAGPPSSCSTSASTTPGTRRCG